jgi:hypothetical protein
LPLVWNIDHSRPSGLADANQDSAPPVTTVTTSNPARTFFTAGRCWRPGYGSHLQDFGTRLADESHHGGGDQPLNNADGEVNRQHQEQESGEGEFRYTREKCLENDAKGSHLQSQNRRRDRTHHNPLPGRTLTDNLSVDERVSNETRKEREIEDVAAQRQQTAIGKKQRLDREDGRHGEEGGVRAQQDAEDHASPEVTTRTSARNREVDHLRGKDERPKDSHERHDAVVRFLLEFPGAVDRETGSGRPHRATNQRRNQCVCHMHETSLPLYIGRMVVAE